MSDRRDRSADALVTRAYRLRGADDARELYRDWAEGYDRSMVDGLGYASPRRTVAALLAQLEHRDRPILDVGCGTGLAAAVLHRSGCTRLTGIDLSEEMLEVAARRGIYAQLLAHDLGKPIPFDDGTFEAAVCTGTFTHGHVDAACLGEIFRILRPGGLFAFTVHLDVWQPLGFADALESMAAAQRIEQVSMHADSFYDTVIEAEGHYCVYRRMQAL